MPGDADEEVMSIRLNIHFFFVPYQYQYQCQYCFGPELASNSDNYLQQARAGHGSASHFNLEAQQAMESAEQLSQFDALVNQQSLPTLLETSFCVHSNPKH